MQAKMARDRRVARAGTLARAMNMPVCISGLYALLLIIKLQPC